MDRERFAAVFLLEGAELESFLQPTHLRSTRGRAVIRRYRWDGLPGLLCFEHGRGLLRTDRSIEQSVGDHGAVRAVGDGNAGQRAVGRAAADRRVIRRVVDAAMARAQD